MNPPEHFAKYPVMLPHVGTNYRADGHKRVLVLGESHYQPNSATQHLNLDHWYNSDESTLNDTEREWVNISKIIRNAKAERYRNKAHGIYRETARELSNAGLNLPEYREGIEHCIFINYFQRPAEREGKSLQVAQKDVHVANCTLEWLLAEYQPELVITVSRLAGRYTRAFLEGKQIPFAVTPHPTTPWWNRTAQSYGGLKGRALFSKLLFEQSWMHQN